MSYRRIVLWAMQTRIWSWLLLRVIPFVRLTTYYTSLRGWKYLRGYALLKPGHIILTTDRKKLTTLLIPGEFTHAALCVAKCEEWECSEMTHTHYTKSAFFDLCKEADRVVILECTDWDPAYTELVIHWCRRLQNAVYDVAFSIGVAALYCSELVFQSDIQRRLMVSLEDIAGLGRPYISPTGIYRAKNVRVVWDSDKEVL